MLLEAVRLGVEVLEHDRVERRKVLREELVDGEGNERGSSLPRVRIVRLGAEDEERDDVDGRVALEPLPERAHVVRRAPSDVQDAHALARDDERERAAGRSRGSCRPRAA